MVLQVRPGDAAAPIAAAKISPATRQRFSGRVRGSRRIRKTALQQFR
jgi:hypothetical protein